MPTSNSEKFRRVIQETRKADNEYRSRQKALDVVYNRWPSYPMVGDQPQYPPSGSHSESSSPSSPPPVTLHPGFGVDGVVVTDFGFGNARVSSLALQPDGKIVAVGFSNNPEGQRSVALARYLSDGSLDATFGSGGTVIQLFGTYSSEALDVVLKPDGKILLSGSASMNDEDFLLACYTPDGVLDSGFGTGGFVSTQFGVDYSSDNGNAIALQSDGKVVVGGGASENNAFALARYDENGVLDNSFDTNGMVTTKVGVEEDKAYDIAIQPDGKIVAAGYSASSSMVYWFGLARYNSDGSLDTGFGNGGKVRILVTPNRNATAYAVLIQPDGKIVAVGTSDTEEHNVYVLTRFNSDGIPDIEFGTTANGVVKIDFNLNGSEAYDATLQPDGKILAAGNSEMIGDESGGGLYAATVARYNTDGSLDTSFGTGGLAQVMFGINGGEVSAILLQPDGKIVVAGAAFTEDTQFGLARFNADGTPDVG